MNCGDHGPRQGGRRRMRMFCLLLPVCALAATPAAFGETAPSPRIQYSSRAWQSDEGLPQNGVLVLAQTRDGYLWVGTTKGLTRFDGHEFKVFNARNTPALKNSCIAALREGRDGSLWIGTAGGGLTRLKDGTFEYYPLNSEERVNSIKTILETKDGSLWVGTLGGLFRRRDGQWTRFTQKEGLQDNMVRALCEVDGELWIGTSGGVNVWKNGAMTNLPAFNDKLVRAVLRDHRGNLWIGWPGGVAGFKDGQVTFYTKQDGLADNNVTTLFEDTRGDLWIGTYGGLSRRAENRFTVERDSQGAFYDQINAMFEDQEGDLWVGSRDGLLELRVKRITTLTRQNGLPHNNVISVMEDHQGSVWAGTWGGGLVRLDKDGMKTYNWGNTGTNGLATDLVLSLYEDREGGLVIGTDFEGGTFRMEDGAFNRIGSRESGSLDQTVRAIVRDRQGNLWFGESTGLILWNTKERCLEGSVIRCLLEDRDGVLWVGTDEGLFCRKNGKFINWSAANDALHGSVIALYEDAAGSLWIGTVINGLNRWKDGGLCAYTTRQGMVCDDVFEILEDDHGWLWMSSSKGIFRVSKKNLDDLDRGRATTIRCIAYDKSDGMESIQCSGVAKPGAWKGRDGRLWFATAKGLAVTDPEISLSDNARVPAVRIEEVVADRRPFVLAPPAANRNAFGSPELRIPPGRGDLEFHFAALSFQAPEKNRFKYKLEGIDADWVEVPRHVAYYNNLPPGKYQFSVLACNNDGVWNRAGASVKIILEPHFWQTWWFRAGLLLLGVAAAAGAVRYLTRRNLQRELRRLEQQRAIELERIRIARDMHDEIGAKLTRISFLGAAAKRKLSQPEEAGAQIDKMSTTARDVIRSVDEIVWALNPANDSLEDLATYLCRNAAEFFDNSPIVCQFNLPPELPPQRLGTEVRHNVILAAKEALNNVLKHSGATTLGLWISAEDGAFKVVISDNGCGFDGAPVPAANGSDPELDTRASRVGNGLANMRHRLESVGGRCQVESAPGQGTRITFTFCLTGEVPEWSANGNGNGNGGHSAAIPARKH